MRRYMMMRAVVLTMILSAPAIGLTAQVPVHSVSVDTAGVGAPLRAKSLAPLRAQSLAPLRVRSLAVPAIVRHERAGSDAAAALSSAFGWVAGGYAGFAAGRLLQPSSADSWMGAAEWWIGAVIGSSLGAAAGAWIGHGMKGNLPGAMLGSILAVPVFGLTAMIFPPALLALPVAQITVSVVVSRPPGQ